MLKTYPLDTPETIEHKLEHAQRYAQTLAKTPRETRQEHLLRLADVVEQRVEKLAKIATEEMGKPIKQARAEVRKCASVCRYYADNADTLLAPQIVAGAGEVHLSPLGPILAIMPWNFPYWQAFRVLAPAMLLGNPVLLKHAENVWGCAHAIADLLEEAELPEATLQPLNIRVERIPPIIEDARIRGVSLTGSERAGRAVASQAGRALKPVVLELGGSDPFIVLEDADFEGAVDAAVNSRFQNNGETCVAAKRILVHASLYDRFTRHYANKVHALECDDPIFESTDVGPLARADLLDNLERQVRETIGYGARCLVGGERKSGRGHYFEPTVLADVSASMVPFREEIFGPVACISVVHDVEEALQLANATSYGLGGAIWTTEERGRALAPQIQSGIVAINGLTASDPRLPFGGIKNSGIGRELGVHGLYAFANIQTILV